MDHLNRLLLIVLMCLTLPAMAYAQSPNLIANVLNRRTVSLNGDWKFIIDPYGTGDGQKYFKDLKPATKSDLLEYSFDAAASLKVPGDWNTQSERLFFYEGAIWYRKLFDYQRKPDSRIFIYFGAANYRTDVYLNGSRVGGHEGGFTPFNFEITDVVKPTGNSLVVKVDSTRLQAGVPTLVTDWWNYGGLTRDVVLIEVPQTFIEDYFVQLRKGSANDVEGWVKLNGNKAGQQVEIQIPEARTRQAVTTDANGIASFSFKADLVRWSPEKPKLYDVTVTSETDRVQDQIGFRTIEVNGGDILLNGKPVFLRGVCIHEEAPLRSGRAYSREDARVLLGWAKEMGANFVRLAHYPHNEFMIREADRMGLMTWSEIPVYWSIAWEDPQAYDTAQTQLTENIARDHNRVSVILWSVANETPEGDARLTFLRKLITCARSLDPTRLLTAAMLNRYEGQTTKVIDDSLGQYLDVLGCNEYIGWYDGIPSKTDNIEWKTSYQKPVVMSEFGAGAPYGLHGDELTRWTEEYQESFYRHSLAMLKKIKFLRGTSPWILMDFRSARRPLAGVQDFYNRKGLVSDRGEKKKAFYVMQDFYRERAKMDQ